MALLGLRWFGGGSSDAATEAKKKFEIDKPDAEWRKQLSAAQYDVLRAHGTERPGSSPLNREKRKGVYVCAGCELPLFGSDTKYESGTGWPSFWQPLPDAVETTTDRSLFMARTGSALPPLRRASRPCLQRRPEAHRASLLHERGSAEIRPGGRGLGRLSRRFRRNCRSTAARSPTDLRGRALLDTP